MITIFIDCIGNYSVKIVHADIDMYERLLKLLKKEKDIILKDTYIIYDKIVKVYFEDEQ